MARVASGVREGRLGRLASWLSSFALGLYGVGSISLLFAIFFGGWMVSLIDLAKTAEWLHEVGTDAVAISCEARMLRSSEIEVRVTLPGERRPVELVAAELALPLRWWPGDWEPCLEYSAYGPPLPVRFAEASNGDLVGAASRDLVELRDRSWVRTTGWLTAICAAVSAAWAILSWRVTRPRSGPVHDLVGQVSRLMERWPEVDWQYDTIVGDAFEVDVLMAQEPARVARVTADAGYPVSLELSFAGHRVIRHAWSQAQELAVLEEFLELAALAVGGPSEVHTGWAGDRQVRSELVVDSVRHEQFGACVAQRRPLRRAWWWATGRSLRWESEAFDRL
jgi:hypothetical protein